MWWKCLHGQPWMLTRDLVAVANFIVLKRCDLRSATLLLLAHIKINFINSLHLSPYCLIALFSFVRMSFTGVIHWTRSVLIIASRALSITRSFHFYLKLFCSNTNTYVTVSRVMNRQSHLKGVGLGQYSWKFHAKFRQLNFRYQTVNSKVQMLG